MKMLKEMKKFGNLFPFRGKINFFLSLKNLQTMCFRNKTVVMRFIPINVISVTVKKETLIVN
jgi:hypothetical protein